MVSDATTIVLAEAARVVPVDGTYGSAMASAMTARLQSFAEIESFAEIVQMTKVSARTTRPPIRGKAKGSPSG
jgi:hypothetical protein